MNRTKSILLAATAPAVLGALLAAPQVASAQSTGAAVVFLPAPSTGTASCPLDSTTNTFAQIISADGQTIVGQSNSDCLTRWQNGVPSVVDDSSQLNRNGFGINLATGMSATGSVIVGTESSFPTRTVIWTATTGSYLPPEPVPGQRAAFGEGYVSSDGTIFAFNTLAYTVLADGQTINSTAAPARVYRWSVANGFVDIGSLGAQYRMIARGISGNGNTIAGTAVVDSTINNPNGQESVAFAWNSSSGLSSLPQLVATPQGASYLAYAEANGISRDGSTIIGASRGTNGLVQATFWRAGTATGLGFLPGLTPSSVAPFAVNATRAFAANVDGSIIVGAAQSATSSTAWRWTAVSGMQDLNMIATNAGLNLNGFVLTDAVGVSDNGQYIAGNSFNAAQNESLGYVLQLAQITQTRLIVTLRGPGVTQTSIVNQSFNTQVDGLLNGTTVFTRTTTDPITGAGGVSALADARAALQVSGGLRRVVIGAPVLISNTTTVLGTTNSTVDVASGTTTSTATINTFGPATVTTGDLGTCATGVVGTTVPTGCSLTGTPVAVDPGVLNSNVYTQTNNTVTPTTTQTVNQLITAKWQIAATAGNRFGTAHALVGPASFERGDRLVMQLLGHAGGNDGGSATIARAASPMKQQMALGDGDNGFSMFGGYFNASTRIDADAALTIARAKGKADGFVLGVQKELGDVARVGIAVDHGTSDYSVRDATYPETLDLKQTQIALFGGWNSGRFALSGAAAYSFGDVKTAIASPGGTSLGTRNISGWSAGAQGSYTLPVGKGANLALVTGVRHSSADLKRFTEVGGLTPLIGLDGETHRTRLYAGLQGEARIALGSATITPRLYGRYAHDSGDASGIANVVFASAPNAAPLQAIGPGVGRDVAELGGSIETQIGGNVAIWAGYDGQFRNSAKSHTAKVGVTIGF